MKKNLLLIVAAAFFNLSLKSQTTFAETTQNCDCNPEGWNQAFVEIIHSYSYTVKCGFQFSLECTETISLESRYKCQSEFICFARFIAVLKNNTTGTVEMTDTSFTFPWRYNFASAGNYSLEITPICGDKKCTPCRFFFTVTCLELEVCDCEVSDRGHFDASIDDNPSQEVACGFQLSLKTGQLFEMSGIHYFCSGDCISESTAVLKNNVTGAVIADYPKYYKLSYTFKAPGKYKLEIFPKCEKKRCEPCVFYFTVKK